MAATMSNTEPTTDTLYSRMVGVPHTASMIWPKKRSPVAMPATKYNANAFMWAFNHGRCSNS